MKVAFDHEDAVTYVERLARQKARDDCAVNSPKVSYSVRTQSW